MATGRPRAAQPQSCRDRAQTNKQKHTYDKLAANLVVHARKRRTLRRRNYVEIAEHHGLKLWFFANNDSRSRATAVKFSATINDACLLASARIAAVQSVVFDLTIGRSVVPVPLNRQCSSLLTYGEWLIAATAPPARKSAAVSTRWQRRHPLLPAATKRPADRCRRVGSWRLC